MYFSILAFAAFVFGQEILPVDTWTLFNSSIACDLETCQYNFFTYKHNSRETSECFLKLTGTPSTRSLFVDQTCQPDAQHTLTVSWAPDQSVILCIADIHENSNAFYGFEMWEIGDNKIAPNKTEYVWRAGEVPPLSTSLTRPAIASQ
ncbi:hypothetical protein F4774DRAFT_387523 [Daldinia eschscholtzii]|nr:hypothetical protein F4774DRAFT_387523 [Daldinia eschscholtzii]